MAHKFKIWKRRNQDSSKIQTFFGLKYLLVASFRLPGCSLQRADTMNINNYHLLIFIKISPLTTAEISSNKRLASNKYFKPGMSESARLINCCRIYTMPVYRNFSPGERIESGQILVNKSMPVVSSSLQTGKSMFGTTALYFD